MAISFDVPEFTNVDQREGYGGVPKAELAEKRSRRRKAMRAKALARNRGFDGALPYIFNDRE
jgi:hypothetical protein